MNLLKLKTEKLNGSRDLSNNGAIYINIDHISMIEEMEQGSMITILDDISLIDDRTPHELYEILNNNK